MMLWGLKLQPPLKHSLCRAQPCQLPGLREQPGTEKAQMPPEVKSLPGESGAEKKRGSPSRDRRPQEQPFALSEERCATGLLRWWRGRDLLMLRNGAGDPAVRFADGGDTAGKAKQLGSREGDTGRSSDAQRMRERGGSGHPESSMQVTWEGEGVVRRTLQSNCPRPGSSRPT